MNKKQTLMVVLTGAALVAISQAQAQTAYQDDDLLLNFRSLSSGVPPNVTVDEGNINTFVTSVGYENTVDLAGAGGQFTAAGLLGAFGSGYPSSSKQIGFSAAAEDPAGSTLWLTRVISAPHANGAGLKVSAQQTADVQSATVTTIQSIGAGYTSDGAQLGAGNASEVPNADPNSYATQGVGIDSTLNFQNQTITAGAGGSVSKAFRRAALSMRLCGKCPRWTVVLVTPTRATSLSPPMAMCNSRPRFPNRPPTS